MSATNIAVVNDILPKLIAEGQNNVVMQCRFLKEINKVRETNKMNPTGLYKPFTVDENNTGYGVAEGGPLLGGGHPEYVMSNIGLRAHWATMEWTGGLERVKTAFLTQLKRMPQYESYNESQLSSIARNFAIQDAVYSMLKTYNRRENFYALQGQDNSAIGVVTSIADIATNKLYYNWADTDAGNRMFGKGQEVQHYHNGVLVNGELVTGFGTVSTKVLKTSTGAVQYSDIDQGIVVGDIAVLRNSYALMPQGVPTYVDDSGTFRGLTRSDNPDIFSSVMLDFGGNAAIGPSVVRELLSKMESKMGYDVPMNLQFWMNKAQYYNWQTFVYNSLIRQVDASAVSNADLSVKKSSWDGHDFNLDVDVPPSQLLALSMLDWEHIVQTPMQPYGFDAGTYVKNIMNSDGQVLDARMSVVFGEHNWVCNNPQSQGIAGGLAFDTAHI